MLRRFARFFIIATAVYILFTIPLTFTLSSTDPTTTILYLPFTVLSLLIAYLLVYRNGYQRIRNYLYG